MRINFVTGNEGKFESFSNIVPEDVELERTPMDYPEDHDSNSTEDIAREGARYCHDELGEPVVVTDAGLFIDSLDGFPGVNTGFALDTIGREGLLKLMENTENRSAVFRLSLAYRDSDTARVFTSETPGSIPESVRGEKGFGFDPVFVPEGHEETFGERPELRDTEGPLHPAIHEFMEWFRSR
ncbi:MAG: non-canonical purine NTP pyrophosphatase [Candidatus Nanohaloarchaea archaeon]